MVALATKENKKININQNDVQWNNYSNSLFLQKD